jgi:hypothetical protein
MKRFLSRASVAGLSAALVAGAAIAAAPAASAAVPSPGNPQPLGITSGVNDLTWNTQNDTFSFVTSDACPAPATNFQIRISGPGLTGTPNIQGNTSQSTVGGNIQGGSFTGPVALTLNGFATAQAQPGGYLGAGTYLMELVCRTSGSSTSLGEFTTQFTVTGSGASSVVARVASSEATTIAVASANPAGSADTVTPVNFTASVSPTNAVGSVQFKVDGVNFGAPVAKSAASATVTSPSAVIATPGAKVVTAEFTGGSGTFANYGNSSSADFPYTITQATQATSTAIVLSAASVQVPDTVTATATVTYGAGSAAPGGSVQFKVNGINAGLPVAVDGSGVATSAPIARSAGTGYAVTAEYLGTTAGGFAYQGSTSAPALFDVTAPAFLPDPQNVEVEIEPGTIIISTPYTPAAPLVLPAMTLNTSATEYSSSAPFEDIIVTDTRPGNLPWTVSAVSTNLLKDGVAAPNINEQIDAQNVGLTGIALVTTNVTPNTFVPGQAAGAPNPTLPTNLSAFDNPAAAHVTAGTPGTLGLGGSSKKVLHANQGIGTSEFAGTLTITAPTNTLDGVYKGVITFTVVGS